MRWLRLWTEILDSRKCQALPAPLFKFWINLLCATARGASHDGQVPSVEDLAFSLRLSDEETKAGLEMLASSGFLDRHEGGFRVHDWTTWQTFGDSGAERQKRYRERKNAGKTSRNGHGDVTGDVTHNGEVTAPLRRVTVPEGELEGEKKRKEKTGGNPPLPPSTSFFRSPGDQHEFDNALDLLRRGKSTAHLASRLDRSRDLPEVTGLEGWRLVVAAMAVARSGKTRDWSYFLAVAKKAHPDEAQPPPRASPEAAPRGRPKSKNAEWRDEINAKLAEAAARGITLDDEIPP